MAAPPTTQTGAIAWARQNLFSSVSNSIVTVARYLISPPPLSTVTAEM